MFLSCGTIFAKYILFFFNAVIFLIGGSVLGLGAWVALRRGFISTFLRIIHLHVSPAFLPTVLDMGGYCLLCAGTMAAILGFLGCLGTLRESTLLLYVYGLSLIAALGIQVAAGAYGVIIHRKHLANLSLDLMQSLEDHYTVEEKADAITNAWNDVMTTNGCCGVFNYSDFSVATKWHRDKIPAIIVPKQCCRFIADPDSKDGLTLMDGNCLSRPTMTNSFFLKGCLDILKTYFVFPAPVAAPICIALGLFQVFGIILTLCLCCELDAVQAQKSRVVHWNSEIFFRDKYGHSKPEEESQSQNYNTTESQNYASTVIYNGDEERRGSPR